MKGKSKTRRRSSEPSDIIELRKNVGRRIKIAREDRGLTQDQLAEKANLKSGGRVSDYERGQYRIGLEVLHRIANAMNVPISEFFNFKSTDYNLVDKKVVQDRVEYLESELQFLSTQVIKIRKDIDKFKKTLVN